MNQYYQNKTEKLEIDVKQELHDQHIEIQEFLMIYQKQQIEYEKVNKNLSVEKDILINLENTYCKYN